MNQTRKTALKAIKYFLPKRLSESDDYLINATKNETTVKNNIYIYIYIYINHVKMSKSSKEKTIISLADLQENLLKLKNLRKIIIRFKADSASKKR